MNITTIKLSGMKLKTNGLKERRIKRVTVLTQTRKKFENKIRRCQEHESQKWIL
jgi:hypothetical protein